MTFDEVRALIDYDSETGVVTWRVARGNKYKAGGVVGSKTPKGYMQVNLGGKNYLLHRVIWLWMTGEWPKVLVDHENGIRDDNRWRNLRAATSQQNQSNSKRRSDNASGEKGVRFHKQRKKWTAQVSIDGKNKHLGVFSNKEEAMEAVRVKRQELHGEFARHE